MIEVTQVLVWVLLSLTVGIVLGMVIQKDQVTKLLITLKHNCHLRENHQFNPVLDLLLNKVRWADPVVKDLTVSELVEFQKTVSTQAALNTPPSAPPYGSSW